MLLAALIVSVGLGAVFGLLHQLPVALADLVLSGGLIFLSVRHRRAWLYAEAALALALTVVHVVSSEDFAPSLRLRLTVDGVNVLGLVILLGAVVARRRRARPDVLQIGDRADAR